MFSQGSRALNGLVSGLEYVQYLTGLQRPFTSLGLMNTGLLGGYCSQDIG